MVKKWVHKATRYAPEGTGGVMRTTLLAAAVGAAAALISRLFTIMIGGTSRLWLEGLGGYRAPATAQEGGAAEWMAADIWWRLPLGVALGGLVVGLLVWWFAPEARGHGTDAAIRAYHRQGGAIRARVPLVKMITSAITIGSGGAAGREGPIAQVAAGVGSALGRWLRLGVAERRTLMLAGMAAGIAASFKAPLGAALFAVEVLYLTLEFETGVLAFCIIASAVAYAVDGFFTGWTPILQVPGDLVFDHGSDLLWFGLLGIICGILGAIIPKIFYGIEGFFSRLPGPPFWKPAVGGLLVGTIALAYPQVLAGGYGWMEQAITGELAWTLMLTLAGLKILAFSLTIGSGGSGGVFAPVLFVGAMVGGALAAGFTEFLPVGAGPAPAALAIVGMTALFAGAARVPIASVVMTAELTGGYDLIVPAMFAVTLAFMVQMVFAGQRREKDPTLYRAQVATRADSPTHQQSFVTEGLRILEGADPIDGAPVKLPDLNALLRFGKPLPVGNRGDCLQTIDVPSDSASIGRQVHQLRQVDRVLIAVILRDGETITPRGATEIEASDRLIVIARPPEFEALRAEIHTPVGAEAQPTDNS